MRAVRVTVRILDGPMAKIGGWSGSQNPRVYLGEKNNYAQFVNYWSERENVYVEIEEGEVTFGPPVRVTP